MLLQTGHLELPHMFSFYNQVSCYGLSLKNGQKIKKLLRNFPALFSKSCLQLRLYYHSGGKQLLN